MRPSPAQNLILLNKILKILQLLGDPPGMPAFPILRTCSTVGREHYRSVSAALPEVEVPDAVLQGPYVLHEASPLGVHLLSQCENWLELTNRRRYTKAVHQHPLSPWSSLTPHTGRVASNLRVLHGGCSWVSGGTLPDMWETFVCRATLQMSHGESIL